ncbi:MAG: AmmeMemoRadiSam system protein B [Actinobacteria bacterium]|nr:AmmeMemoRadiSam system protein B [Actinomycetota bacterium]
MRTGRVRPPAVAGMFYPADPAALQAAVTAALEGAGGPPPGTAPKAVIAPHAGYVFSGPVAASAYARVQPLRGQVERVVLMGPAHTIALDSIAASGADAFATPLGLVPVDTEARDRLVAAGKVVVSDRAHAAEHSLEVHLPFIQLTLGDVAIVPLVVGQVAASRVADALEEVWGGPETLVVVSSDLSHYHDHRSAQTLDRRTAAAIVSKDAEALGSGDACGVFPVRGLLVAARRRGLDVELIDLRTSADTAGDPDRVVGYGAFAVA